MLDSIIKVLTQNAPAVDYWSIRLVEEQLQSVVVRQNIVQPVSTHSSLGVCVSVIDNDGMGYAATSDFSASGVRHVWQQAQSWAQQTQGLGFGVDLDRMSYAQGEYKTPTIQDWHVVPLGDKISLLRDACAGLQIHSCIVDSIASIRYRHTDVVYVASNGSRIEQSFDYLMPGLKAVANDGSQTQQRTGGGDAQGGMERLAKFNFPNCTRQIAEEAIALLHAPECPSGNMQLLLMPDQMVLQIHESIGHPLELDRILGDERNYAGTSFVTPDMFGQYQYGSPLLNVTFDPTRPEQLASYGYDDDGSVAERCFIIQQGRLERPLGSAYSQQRAQLPGIANARACDWNRPSIDRMANLNIEPGDKSMEALISEVEDGVLMSTNRSWSIDDSRNKFQFGCELGQLIEQGELKHIVRNPNYRGISASFWRNLTHVGDDSTYQVLGVTNCGKGEPNQAIYVGHASPACVFDDVEVFGGAE